MFFSKKVDTQDWYRAMAPLSGRLIRWIEEFGFFELIDGTSFDTMFLYDALCRCFEFYWTLMCSEDPFFFTIGLPARAIGLMRRACKSGSVIMADPSYSKGEFCRLLVYGMSRICFSKHLKKQMSLPVNYFVIVDVHP